VMAPVVPSTTLEKPKDSDQFEWVTIEQSGELVYEAPETIAAEPPPPPINKQQQMQGQSSSSSSSSSSSAVQTMSPIPAHSLAAFGLFLRLPGYAEVLLKERKHAQCLLRLVLGVTDDGEGSKCSSSSFNSNPGSRCLLPPPGSTRCSGSWLTLQVCHPVMMRWWGSQNIGSLAT